MNTYKKSGVICGLDELNRFSIPKSIIKEMGLQDKNFFKITIENNFVKLEKIENHNKELEITTALDELGKILIPMRIRKDIAITKDTQFTISYNVFEKSILLEKYREKPILCEKCLSEI